MKVPSHKKIHAVDDSQSNMQSILRVGCWDRAEFYQRCGKVLCLIRYF